MLIVIKQKMVYTMNKKNIIFIITILLIAPIISTQACASNSSTESSLDDLRIFTFETQTQVTIDEETIPTERINPGETKELSKSMPKVHGEFAKLFTENAG